ncbi:hypothetical protein VIGAN_02198100 [Vigna angularis var. angularis]|uniref:Uncharacterized protein n=1 Tax=Vigna angularis var. angularis TaxID=157739 RepID=A0A0S3REQ1_PHAAN|nr:hypothetical protein VIGAN_02198100 [Vigna angularis var. angularis]
MQRKVLLIQTHTNSHYQKRTLQQGETTTDHRTKQVVTANENHREHAREKKNLVPWRPCCCGALRHEQGVAHEPLYRASPPYKN